MINLGNYKIQITEIIINKGAKPIRCGQDNLLFGHFGGRTYFLIKIFDAVLEAKNKEIPKNNLDVLLTKSDSKIQIKKASMKFQGNDLVIETEEFEKFCKQIIG